MKSENKNKPIGQVFLTVMYEFCIIVFSLVPLMIVNGLFEKLGFKRPSAPSAGFLENFSDFSNTSAINNDELDKTTPEHHQEKAVVDLANNTDSDPPENPQRINGENGKSAGSGDEKSIARRVEKAKAQRTIPRINGSTVSSVRNNGKSNFQNAAVGTNNKRLTRQDAVVSALRGVQEKKKMFNIEKHEKRHEKLKLANNKSNNFERARQMRIVPVKSNIFNNSNNNTKSVENPELPKKKILNSNLKSAGKENCPKSISLSEWKKSKTTTSTSTSTTTSRIPIKIGRSSSSSCSSCNLMRSSSDSNSDVSSSDISYEREFRRKLAEKYQNQQSVTQIADSKLEINKNGQVVLHRIDAKEQKEILKK